MIPQTTINIKSAVKLNTFDTKVLFKLADYGGLYIGEKHRYKTLGKYDNTSNSLQKITDNDKIYSLFVSRISHISMIKLIVKEKYTIADLQEFYNICKQLNIKINDDLTEEENKILYNL